jgi:hypothetical protein
MMMEQQTEESMSVLVVEEEPREPRGPMGHHIGLEEGTMAKLQFEARLSRL